MKAVSHIAKKEHHIVSKPVEEKIILLKIVHVNQWRNIHVSTVVQWFKNIVKIPESKLIKFSIK